MTIQEKLNGSKILFISVRTFNYEKEIAGQLRFFGAQVDFYDERPSNSIFVKGIIRLKRNLYQKKIIKYYTQILKHIENEKYDYLFVIKGEVIPAFFLEKFKTLNPDCFGIFYSWDSFANNPHSVSILKYFEECFTFDINDAIKYKINFRPLFYIEKYGELRSIPKTDKNKYDLLFIGTAHTDRYLIGRKVDEWCKTQNLKIFTYYYMPSKLVFLFKYLFDSSFKNFKFSEIVFHSLSTAELLQLYGVSKAVLDINHPLQSGLTMRTFESLGAGKKLITTNQFVVDYPFYNENNICVIDRDNPVLEKTFFETPFTPYPEDLIYHMSLSGWISELFLRKSANYWIK